MSSATTPICPTVGVHGRHPVSFAPGSRLASVIGPQTDVATYHHQAVDRLPAEAQAIGWAPDGTVEAFEVCGAAWTFGVQWHPEVHDGHGAVRRLRRRCRRLA